MRLSLLYTVLAVTLVLLAINTILLYRAVIIPPVCPSTTIGIAKNPKESILGHRIRAKRITFR